MNRAKGGTLLLAGTFLVFLGLLIQSDVLEMMLDILGVIVVVVGLALGIVGLIRVFSPGGREKRGGEYDY